MSGNDYCTYHNSVERISWCSGPEGYCEVAYDLEMRSADDDEHDAALDCVMITSEEKAARDAKVRQTSNKVMRQWSKALNMLADR